MLMLPTVADAEFPALSVHVPRTDCPAPSDESNVGDGGLPAASSDVASEQLKLTVTLVLFHPLALAPGVLLPVIDGAVASRLMVTDCELVPPALVAEHVNVMPVVSVVRVVKPQPVDELIEDSGSSTVHNRFTLLVYQSLFPSVPVID